VEEEIETIQYLTFTMADELVVVDGARVREILELSSLTKGTLLPDFMQGVIDMRGCLVPVIDLQLKLAMQEHLQPPSTFNISVELAKANENVVLSGLVDSVQEAGIEMAPSQIDANPHWLRCKLSKNDFKALFSNFINASVTNTVAKPKGDDPWPL
jgi:chemotaxis signal transduction protein